MTFVNRARYLIQTRTTGEAWATHCTAHERDQAEALADTLAAQTRPAGWRGALIPTFPYVRVSWKGSTVYDPRAHTTQATPRDGDVPRKSISL